MTPTVDRCNFECNGKWYQYQRKLYSKGTEYYWDDCIIPKLNEFHCGGIGYTLYTKHSGSQCTPSNPKEIGGNEGQCQTGNVCALGSDSNAYHMVKYGSDTQYSPFITKHSNGKSKHSNTWYWQTTTATPFGDSRDLIYGFEVNLQGVGQQHVIYIYIPGLGSG